MKTSELQDLILKGGVVLVGEYLGTNVETQKYLDKVSGRKCESQFVHHLLLLKGEVVRLVERFDLGEKVTAIAKKGELLAVFAATVERKNGSTVCRANRKDIHTMEG